MIDYEILANFQHCLHETSEKYKLTLNDMQAARTVTLGYVFFHSYTLRKIVVGFCSFTSDVHLSFVHLFVFLFPYDNLRKYQWIFSRLGLCIDIVKIWFGLLTGKFCQFFDRVICLPHVHIFVSR